MIKKLLLNLYFWPIFVIITLIAFLLIPVIWTVNELIFKVPENRAFRIGVRIYGWVLVRLVPFFAPVTLEERAGNRPTTGIYVANHNSAVDPYCFGVLPGEYAFLTSWPFGIPVYSWAMKKSEYLNTKWGWETLLERSTRLLHSGCSLIIWPEGHRSKNGRLGSFENGAFRLACETGYPIIPVCITGTGKLMAPGNRMLTPAQVKLNILPEHAPPAEGCERQKIMKLKQQVKDAMQAELQREKNG